MRDISTKVNNGGATADGRLEASEYNDVQLDIENGVIRSGQTLNAADTLQMGRQSFLNAVGAQSFIDSGSANAIVLTPITGASGYVMAENYTQLNGARILCTVAAANTGAVTVNIGQTAGTLLGVKSLVDLNGLALTSGFYQTGDLIELQYKVSSDNFTLINNLTKNATPSNYIVRYITTANITLSGLGTQAGGDWGAALTAGDLILVANQTTGGENGWYNAAAGAWTRATFANTSAKIKSGSLTQVTEGSTLADTIWILTTDGAIVLGTTPLVFARKDVLVSMHGQCRLSLSAGNLLLSPYNGNQLIINGVVQAIPSAGVTLAPPATTLTLYYIYAYMNSGVMTLEGSTTAPSTDTATGIQIKTGDVTRTLVGMARTVTNAWVDTEKQRFVLSWFNRKRISGRSWLTADRTTTSATFVEINTEIRVEFITWADEGISLSAQGRAGDNATPPIVYFGIGLDSTTVPVESGTGNQLSNADMSFGFTHNSDPLSVGYHYATLLATVNDASTLSIRGSATTGKRTTLNFVVNG